MRTSFHHQPEAQHPIFQLSTSWQADYPIFRANRTLSRHGPRTEDPFETYEAYASARAESPQNYEPSVTVAILPIARMPSAHDLGNAWRLAGHIV